MGILLENRKISGAIIMTREEEVPPEVSGFRLRPKSRGAGSAYTEINPAYGLLKKILPPKNKRNLSEPDPFNRQDYGGFLEAAWAKLPEPFPLILEVMGMSGMRLGEALAMCWENLDSRNCQYNVAETTRHGRFGPPKSGKRHIDLDETLVGKLDPHIKKLRKDCMATGVQPRYLFPGITQRMVQGAVKRACVAAGLRSRHPP